MKKTGLLPLFMLAITSNLFATNINYDIEQTFKYSRKSIKSFIGVLDLIEGAESLVKEQNGNPILGVQRLMEGVTSLIEARIAERPIDVEEQLNLVTIIDEFRYQIDILINSDQIKSSFDAESERKKLMEGLMIILYNTIYMLIDQKSISTCLKNILSGTYKVVSFILSDGKIDYNDWQKLLIALASIFNLGQIRVICLK